MHKDRHTDQWNRFKSPYICGHLTKVLRHLNGERIFFSTNGTETTGHSHKKDINLDLTPFT